MASQKYILGFILLAIAVTLITITLPENVQIKISTASSIFSVWENNAWVKSGVETNALFNGTRSVSRTTTALSSIILGNTTTIKRTAKYGKATIVDTYFFDGDIADKEMFPVYHTIEVFNGSGFIYQYKADSLEYSGPTTTNVSSPQSFGHNMKITWGEGNYYSKLYNSPINSLGYLLIKYRVNSDYEKYDIRLFDPITSLCYQETATTSTACGGLDTGAYGIGSITSGHTFMMNYSKPTDSTNSSLWQIKYGTSSCTTPVVPYFVNISIPGNCWSAVTDKIVLKVDLASPGTIGGEQTYAQPMCWNGATWTNVGTRSTLSWSDYLGGCNSGTQLAASANNWNDGNWGTNNIGDGGSGAGDGRADQTSAKNTLWYEQLYEEGMWWDIDDVAPAVTITYPTAVNYTINVSALNYTVSDNNLQSCWYSLNGGANVSITCGTNKTGLTSIEGSNTWRVYANDTSGNINNSASVTFFKDTLTPPNATLINPSDNFYSNNSNINFTANVSDVSGLSNATVFIYNQSNRVLINKTTISLSGLTAITGKVITLIDGIYTWFYQVFDTSNNNYITANRTLTVDTTYPLISWGTGIANNGANLSQNFIYLNTTWTEINFANITFRVNNSLSYINDILSCYQESANVTNQVGTDGNCGLNYSGTYQSVGSWHLSQPARLTYDGNWSTYGGSNVNFNTTLYINYSKPSTSLSSSPIWQVKSTLNFTQTTYFVNISIPEDCYSLNPIRLLVNLTQSRTNTSFSCYNSSSSNWVSLLVTPPTAPSMIKGLYEEAIYWQVNPIDYTFNSLADGTYFYNTTICDLANNCNTTTTRKITLDNVYPQFTNFGFNYTNNTVYKNGRVYTANATISNTNSTAKIEFSGVNYTTTNISSLFTANIGQLGSGTYSYYWWSYSNGTAHTFNSSSINYYTVNKATNNGTIFNNGTFSYPYSSSVNGTVYNVGDGGCTYKLYRTNVAVSNPDVVTLGGGVYTYVYNTTGCANYSSGLLDTRTLTISQNSTYVQTLTVNPSSPIIYPTQSNFTCSNSVGLANSLYINGVDKTAENGLNVTRSANSTGYNVTCITTATANYSSKSTNVSFVINKASSTSGLNITGTTPIVFGTTTDIAYSENNTEDGGCSYSIDKSNAVYGVGTVTFNYSTSGCINYSAGSKTKDIVITQATPVLTFKANGGTSNLSLIYPQQINISASANFGTVGLGMNGADYLANNSLNVTLLPGDYIFRANITGNQNYSNVGYSYYNVTINSSAPPTLSIVYPLAINYTSNVSSLNYTISGLLISSCWYSLNSGVTNISVSCGNNLTGLKSIEGTNNWTIYANNTNGFLNSSRVSFFKDTIAPNVTITYPVNGENYSTDITELKSIMSADAVFCKSSTNGGITNVTLTCGTNLSSLTANEGYNTWLIIANDTYGNQNTSRTTFVKDTISPVVTYLGTTDDDLSTVTRSYIVIDVTVTETFLKNVTIFFYNSAHTLIDSKNSTASPFYSNFTGLANGNYFFKATAYDYAGHSDTTSERKVTVDVASEPVVYAQILNSTSPYNKINDNLTVFYSVVSPINRNVTIQYEWYKDNVLNSTTLITDGLISYFPLDNDVLDYFGNNDGIKQETTNTSGKISGAYLFNGINSSINGTVTGVNSSTMWIKPTSTDVWEFAAFNGTTFFLNGAVGSPSSYPLNISGTQFKIGINETGGTFFNGTIDEIQIYNRTLTNIEIKQLYDGSRNGGNVLNSFLTAGEYWKVGLTGYDYENAGDKVYTNNILINSYSPNISYGIGTEANNSIYSRGNIYINVSVTDVDLFNLTIGLYNSTSLVNSSNVSGQSSGSWVLNATGLVSGTYYFNATACNVMNSCSSSVTYLVNIDQVNPQISIVYPLNNSNFTITSIGVNYTLSDAYLSSCKWTSNSGVTNNSISCGTNISYSASQGNNTIVVYANDTSGNTNSSSVKFFVDSIYPLIDYGIGTEVNGVNKSQTNIYINTTWTETNFKNITFRMNSTSIYFNTTGINLWNFTNVVNGVYTYNVTICDVLNQCNTTSNRVINLDTIKPLVSLVTPTLVTGTVINNSFININSSATDTYLKNNTIYVYNSSNSLVASKNALTEVNYYSTVLADGFYTYNSTACDYAENCNSSTLRNITLDTTAPVISFVYPTPNTNTEVISLFVNVSVSDLAFSSVTINVYNSSRSLIRSNLSSSSNYYVDYSNLTGLGVYYFNVTANDSFGKISYSETRTINITVEQFVLSFLPSTTANNTYFTNVNSNLTINLSYDGDNSGTITTYVYNVTSQYASNSSNYGLSTYSIVYPNIPSGTYYFNATMLTSDFQYKSTETRILTVISPVTIPIAYSSGIYSIKINATNNTGLFQPINQTSIKGAWNITNNQTFNVSIIAKINDTYSDSQGGMITDSMAGSYDYSASTNLTTDFLVIIPVLTPNNQSFIWLWSNYQNPMKVWKVKYTLEAVRV